MSIKYIYEAEQYITFTMHTASFPSFGLSFSVHAHIQQFRHPFFLHRIYRDSASFHLSPSFTVAGLTFLWMFNNLLFMVSQNVPPVCTGHSAWALRSDLSIKWKNNFLCHFIHFLLLSMDPNTIAPLSPVPISSLHPTIQASSTDSFLVPWSPLSVILSSLRCVTDMHLKSFHITAILAAVLSLHEYKVFYFSNYWLKLLYSLNTNSKIQAQITLIIQTTVTIRRQSLQ